MIPYKTYVRKKHVESILGTCKNMTEHSIQFEYYNPTQCTISQPLNITFQGVIVTYPRYVIVTFNSTLNSFPSILPISYPHMSQYHLPSID